MRSPQLPLAPAPPARQNVRSWIYCAAVVLLGITFCGFGIICARTKSRPGAKQLFLASIVYLPTLLAMTIDRC